MKPILKVENLSKRYRIGTRAASYMALRDIVSEAVRAPLNFIGRRNQHKRKPAFWALRDIDFDVEAGEIVAFIGHNGAGKSTLLKIMSRITEPTGGRITLYGKVNSILEVGTGFHPELTGRENIFVNGAILGMSRAEIKRRFDEIVDFAGIEKFLDTMVKHYSSGMYMKLAFAVAAHLDSDILIIDEVLSVGDGEFQKKCLGKMQDVAKSGRTILFVSHNLAAVENLCSRGIVLEKGEISYDGTQTEAISHYLSTTSQDFKTTFEERPDRSGSGELRITAIEIKDSDGRTIQSARCGQDIELHFHFKKNPDYNDKTFIASFMIRTPLEVPVFLQHNHLTQTEWKHLPPRGIFVCRIRRLPLPPAVYRLGFSVFGDDEYLDRIDNAVELDVTGGDFYGSGEVPPISHGCSLVDAEWELLGSE